MPSPLKSATVGGPPPAVAPALPAGQWFVGKGEFMSTAGPALPPVPRMTTKSFGWVAS